MLFSDDYDEEIESAASLWLPGIDHRWLKSLLYQESRFNTRAVSPVGARGIAQFMAPTFEEVRRELGWGDVSPFMAEYAIQAAGYYLAKQIRAWTTPRPQMDRLLFGIASYNAGVGGVLGAQRRCNNAVLYRFVHPCLPAETKGYTVGINRWYAMLVFGL